MTSHPSILLLATALSSVTPLARAEAQVSVVNNSIQEQQASAGSEYQGSIVLRNDGPESQHVRVYLTDYSFTANGVSAFAEPGSSPRSNARWITFGSQSVVVAAYQSSTVTYRVTVPELPGASGSGSFWSIAMIEGESVTARPAANQRGVQLNTVVRHGIQLVTHVGTTGAASVAFSNVTVLTGDSGPTLQFDSGNNGQRARRLSLSVDLYAEDGTLVGRFTKERGLVYPGCSIRQTFSIGALKKGNYTAFVVADAGDDDLFAGNFKLKF